MCNLYSTAVKQTSIQHMAAIITILLRIPERPYPCNRIKTCLEQWLSESSDNCLSRPYTRENGRTRKCQRHRETDRQTDRERQTDRQAEGERRVKSKETVGNSWTVLKIFWVTNIITIVKWVQIYRLQPKSATKGRLFHIFFIFDCFESASQIGNGERSRRSADR